MGARRSLAVALMLLAGLLLVPAVAGALGVNEVARELRCPTCNSPLDVSHSPVANDMKAFIAARIDDGWTKQQIIDAMVDDFGEQVLATPPKRGFNLIAWVVPILVLIGGIILVPWLTRLWTRRSGGETAPNAPEISADDRDLIEREMRRRDL